MAGVTKSYGFDSVSKRFALVYTARARCKLPTEIYLNEELHYARGYNVSIAVQPPRSSITWR